MWPPWNWPLPFACAACVLQLLLDQKKRLKKYQKLELLMLTGSHPPVKHNSSG